AQASANAVQRPPANAAETILVQTWAKILDRAACAVTDDFFAAGGDSIRALQMIATLRAAGWSARLGELFQSPRLEDFARTLGRATSYSEIGRHPAASKRLSPIQDWFFNAHVDSPWYHFNQGLVLELSPAIDERRLAQAWRLLGQRHPMLRSRF